MTTYKFVDLFSGCGGLSLGLSMAGLQGQFAVEKDSMAFETFSDNFLGRRNLPVAKFSWPTWLEKKAWAIDDLLDEHRNNLLKLKGSIHVLAGGPPCQGFSFAGRRLKDDPRNMLFEKYVETVRALKPLALILENVPGMLVAHADHDGSHEHEKSDSQSYFQRLTARLEDAGYSVKGKIVDASKFGVPQRRSRLIVIGIRSDLAYRLRNGIDRAFDALEEARNLQLKQLNLKEQTSAMDAISDLRADGPNRKECTDIYSPAGFQEARYEGPPLSIYQKLMHKYCRNPAMDSMRLARHGDEVRARFKKIIADDTCAKGVRMNEAAREKYGLKKHRIFPMSPSEPAPTITTLPDDILHYAEPRILTVRESARLQSFPDWFRFRGKFTTGGHLRTKECPRYTQVGNAVPPLLARAIGIALTTILNEITEPPLNCSEEWTTDSLDMALQS